MRTRILHPLLLTLVGGCGEPVVEIGPPPPTRVEILADTMHGQVVEDPYRWLEDQASPETRAWIEVQDAYTDAVFTQLPGRQRIKDLMTAMMRIDEVGTPTEKGGRYFFSRRAAEDDLSILYYREGYDGTDQVIIDPHGMSDDHTTSVRFADISDDGRFVIYSVREGGADEVSLRIRDVDAGVDLTDTFPTQRYGNVQLTPDGTGFYYGPYGGEQPRIYYHAVGTDVSQDQELFGENYGAADILWASLSDDGRWLLVTVLHGGAGSGGTALYLKDLHLDREWVEVINDGRSRTFGGFAGDELLLTTNLGADNYRVMTADLTRPQVDYWKEFLAARDDVVIESASAVGGYYFVNYLENVRPHLAQYDTDGNLVRQVEFETLGSVFGPYGGFGKPEAFVRFTSFHVPTTTYRLDVNSSERAVWFRPEIPIATERFEVEQVWFESRDGTRVPMFIVHHRDLELNSSQPTLLSGYGGFGSSRRPSFDAFVAAWLSMGGVYAVANLRGGGEFGEEWHEAGMLANKQNVFDDFIAAAEYLITEDYTRSERLAISGASNGGLLVGAAMTQRPELFGAVVCRIPLLDMLRYDQFLGGPFWINEYGSSAYAEQFEYLKAYSPYHNVRAGTSYPATLFITGDADTRVDPMHARKMTALVQAANAGTSPILLRYHPKVGHSGALPLAARIEEDVDVLTFLRWRVGQH